MEYLVSPQQFQLEIMNDDLIALEELRKRIESDDSLRGMVDVGHGVSTSKSEKETLFDDVPRERKTTIQSIQKISPTELMSIPEDRREEFLDHIKERALHGMIEQADLINAVSYEEGDDPMTHEKIIIAKLKVIIE